MSTPAFPPLPSSLKAIQHYMKIALEYDKRDPSIAYWCRLYALQQGLVLDAKSKEALTFLTTLMTWLENVKKNLKSDETVANEIVAQAHVENHALKLFFWADSEDRLQHLNKNVVKAFYTAGMLLEVCSTFGEASEEIAQQKKYAKWRAAHLNTCLKTGEPPQEPAPKPDEEILDELENEEYNIPTSSVGANLVENISPVEEPKPTSFAAGYVSPQPEEIPTYHQESQNPSLTAEQLTHAQKLCKYASSALTYEDIPTAVDNLEKALRLLKTGK